MKIFNKKAEIRLRKSIEKFGDFCEKNVDEKNGKFRVIASTDDVDRHGEVIVQSGWDIKNFMKNPVILFGHRSGNLPIGKATNVKIEKGEMIIEGIFASAEGNPLAQQVRALYDEGILKTVSVGLIIKKRDENDSNLILEAELLELSFVPIPANPNALDALKEAGIKTLDLDLIQKQIVDGVEDEEKEEEKEGDYKEEEKLDENDKEDEEEKDDEECDEEDDENNEEKLDDESDYDENDDGSDDENYEHEDDENKDEDAVEDEDEKCAHTVTVKVDMTEEVKTAFKKMSKEIESIAKEVRGNKKSEKRVEKHPEGSPEFALKMGAQCINKISQKIIENLKK